MSWLSFTLGAFVGASIGLLVAALCFAAAEKRDS